jgi:hypothetical protein
MKTIPVAVRVIAFAYCSEPVGVRGGGDAVCQHLSVATRGRVRLNGTHGRQRAVAKTRMAFE